MAEPTQHAEYVAEPIKVWCEGSGCPPAFESVPMCPMCGQFPQLRSDGTMTGHQRRDLLAEIERGDFG